MLQSDVVPTLQAAGARVVVLTPDAEMTTCSDQVDVGSLVLEPLRLPPKGPPPGGRVMKALRSVVQVMRRSALDGRASPRFAPRYRRQLAAYKAMWPKWLSLPVHFSITQGLWRSSLLRRVLTKVDVKLSTADGHAHVFDRYRPDVVVGAGLGYFRPDEAVYQEAARRGIRVVSLVSGWDNPSKGYRAVDFDRVVAWGPRMQDEIVRHHDVPRKRVVAAGVPYWDIYFRDDALPSREELCYSLGLDPAKQIVLHATFPPNKNSPPFLEIASRLAEATARGDLGTGAQLVVRLHPKYMRPDKDDARRPYEQLEELEGVFVNRPVVESSSPLSYDTTAGDARTLGGLLRHCDVLVNVFSTTTLEALLLDRSVVMVVPDPAAGAYPENSYLEDPDRWHSFLHVKPVVEGGAARIARNSEEILEHVRAYLADSSLDRASRRAVAWGECGPTDGHAGERTAHHILESAGLGGRLLSRSGASQSLEQSELASMGEREARSPGVA